MFGKQAHEPQSPQYGGGHGRVHVTRARVPPRPAAVGGGGAGTRLVETVPAKFAVSGRWPVDSAKSWRCAPCLAHLIKRPTARAVGLRVRCGFRCQFARAVCWTPAAGGFFDAM